MKPCTHSFRCANGATNIPLGILHKQDFTFGNTTFSDDMHVSAADNYTLLLGNTFLAPARIIIDYQKLCIHCPSGAPISSTLTETLDTIPIDVYNEGRERLPWTTQLRTMDDLASKKRRSTQVTPRALKRNAKTQEKYRAESQKKRPARMPRDRGAHTSFKPGDFVVLYPKDRTADVDPEIMKVADPSIVQGGSVPGRILIMDNSNPPQIWWEPAGNLGLFMKAGTTSDKA